MMNGLRFSFSKSKFTLEIPPLIEVQINSYKKFLQADVPKDKRENVGIEKALKDFKVEVEKQAVKGEGLEVKKVLTLEFVDYRFDEVKYTPLECRKKGLTYGAPMRVKLRITVGERIKRGEKEERRVSEIREQEVFFGEIPFMTPTGSFIINGTERVIVNQLHKSPGVYFELDKSRLKAQAKPSYVARLIPYKGVWLDFGFDMRDIMYIKLDKKKKFNAVLLLRALGFSDSEILKGMYKTEEVKFKGERVLKKVVPEVLRYQRASRSVGANGEVVLEAGKKFTSDVLKKMKQLGIDWIEIDEEDLIGKIVAEDVVANGKLIVRAGKPVDEEALKKIREEVRSINIVFFDDLHISGAIIRTMEECDKKSKARTQEDACMEIFRRTRPAGEPTDPKIAVEYIRSVFFSQDRYNLSRVGRVKLSSRLNLDIPQDILALTREDVFAIVKYLFDLKNNIPGTYTDDIDHLANRRVRPVGELAEMFFITGLEKVRRLVRDKLSGADPDMVTPAQVVNFKPVVTTLKEFFTTSQLSQFLDQTNPLAELTHKRRLSALGPGGLTRSTAKFEVRDVHPSHYAKICPIETPEGQNIGLITSLAVYAGISELGFLQAPYRKVEGGVVKNDIEYLTALEEERYAIAPFGTPVDESGRIIPEVTTARVAGEVKEARREEIKYMDASPVQILGVSASLVPFLEHDDSNRALMGANMQRQAVPLLVTEAPLVGTGIEGDVAKKCGAAVVAKHSGVVEYVDSTRIVVRIKDEDFPELEGSTDIYSLVKFEKTNQSTCVNQRPLVRKGNFVKRGQVIADGPCTAEGEFALGRNVLVCFLPWRGHNFEDSIVISERLVRDDIYTSIHMNELVCDVKETKLGDEEITRDIPGVPPKLLENLDENGIVKVGAKVGPGDILVGKITPKGETYLTPEERLLRAIFGKPFENVKNSSLRCPPDISGVVIATYVHTRRGERKDQRAKEEEEKEIARLEKDKEDAIKISRSTALSKIRSVLVGVKIKEEIKVGRKGRRRGEEVDSEFATVILKKLEKYKMLDTMKDFLRAKVMPKLVLDEDAQARIEMHLEYLDEQEHLIKTLYDSKIREIRRGDELPPGVIKRVRVLIASKRKITVGDKIAGRHGNKGVISIILPQEDMPFLPDGTPVDVVLSPLGVPSRMNIGQLLEIQLGWISKELGRRFKEIVEHTGSEAVEGIKKVMKEALMNGGGGEGAIKSLCEWIDSLCEEEILEIARRGGVMFASPPFDGAREEDIRELSRILGIPEDSKVWLRDGRTGELFKEPVAVGYVYLMRLVHMVEDKIHARSTGPYSLITQQPLGGKSREGGQRLGEMEVWALEGYGAAYTLQEMLTVKSDDVLGRYKVYDSIVKGKPVLEPSIPESLNVLIKELQALGLDIQFLTEREFEEIEGEVS